ncbi:pantoate--beta-alanine ligase [Jatrophihabitans sp.]|uniref:pantoate--beta-alanine ligase n=1 Tax=Jatrophihabitans sp. TaxID=1932789 RepID=UPI002BB8D6ED|nr:pantoate--beta-alanine ligase [Jatrophihabitans sp.]
MTELVRTRAELAAARARLADGLGPAGVLGLVPTMGALHAGHQALFETAREQCAAVVASIFVNPMQFSQAEDLARYPRRLAEDLALCERHGVDLAWAPDVTGVYPDGPVQVWVTAGALADQLEGPNRPGHFDGVLTVVTKLFAAVRPDRAYFGEKDYQQLMLVRRMVHDLGQQVQVVAVPTVREPDGLALSSRNVLLSPAERERARALSAALMAGRDAAGSAEQVLAAAEQVLAAADGVKVEYLELRDPGLGPAPVAGPARLLVAARVGSVRLIDNLAVELGR